MKNPNTLSLQRLRGYYYLIFYCQTMRSHQFQIGVLVPLTLARTSP
jgi:hypothetical protein